MRANAPSSAATPLAISAGAIISAAFISDMHFVLNWSLAIIAEGGLAGTIHAGLAGIRFGSSLTTGGFANSVVSTFVWIAVLVMSVLAVFLPILAAIVAVALFVRFAYRFDFRRSKPTS